MPIVTLTTDFGTKDGYVGAMKGVLLSICPELTIVDITHEVPPQDVREGAFCLSEVVPFFPPKTLHIAVVDPGVGSARRGVAIETDHGIFVGPDNGIFSPCLRVTTVRRAVELREPSFRRPEVSRTFHGRDVFAPAAAHLARGVPLTDLGPLVDDLVPLPLREPVLAPGFADGEVVHVDRFGNLVTNIAAGEIPHPVRAVELGFLEIRGITSSYADVEPGSYVALVGSRGFLEIAVRDGSAAARLGLARGAKVVVRSEPQR